LAISATFVAPALVAARQWAQWSVDHGALAPELDQSASQAAVFTAVIVVIFLLNIPVAVWKPLAAVRWPKVQEQRVARGSQS
jgi:hypothetical protein